MRIGIIGGTGQLGRALVTAWLETRLATPDSVWICNRSGSLGALGRWPDIRTTTNPNDLSETCEVIVPAVPPGVARTLRFHAGEALVISVMAGVTLDDLRAATGSMRVVRAMSSPAAALRLAYSPWTARDGLSETDTDKVTRLLSACGLTDRVASEDHIDRFTAMTGPVPGFVAACADAFVDHARRSGISDDMAVRAVHQLFLGAATSMALDGVPPAQHVREMLDYDGTTAAGLRVLRDGPFAGALSDALEASYKRCKTI